MLICGYTTGKIRRAKFHFIYFIFHIKNQKNIHGKKIHCTDLTHKANEKQIYKT